MGDVCRKCLGINVRKIIECVSNKRKSIKKTATLRAILARGKSQKGRAHQS